MFLNCKYMSKVKSKKEKKVQRVHILFGEKKTKAKTNNKTKKN